MKTLADIRSRIVEIIGKPDFLPFVNARLVLRTGISLSQSGACSLDELNRVLVALEDMGYDVNGEKTLKGKKKS